MANTILEKLQEKYPNAEGINDARNIAEAVACISGKGGRGANAIADAFPKKFTVTFDVNGASESIDPITVTEGESINLRTDLTGPNGEEFNHWREGSNGDFIMESTYTPVKDIELFATWRQHTFDGVG